MKSNTRSRITSVDNSLMLTRKSKIQSPLKRKDIDYTFSEGPSFLD